MTNPTKPAEERDREAAEAFSEKDGGGGDPLWVNYRSFLAGAAHTRAELQAELSECPREEWECARIQRRLEAELSAEREKVRVMKEALVGAVELLEFMDAAPDTKRMLLAKRALAKLTKAEP